MHTLTQWSERLTQLPLTIECPEMHLLGRDHEPPVFIGPGLIQIRSKTEIDFSMFAVPRNSGEAFKRLVRAKQNPYQMLDQFRLEATDYNGNHWSCGWTTVQLGESLGQTWNLSGSLHSLQTGVSGKSASPESGVELIFDTNLRIPMPMNMVTTTTRDGEEIFWSRGAGRKIINAVGTQIEFFCDPASDYIWVNAKTSSDMPHPYAENWLSEPLCMLLGQLIFPRLVARNFGDGRASISLRPSPAHTANSAMSTLLGEDPLGSPEQFWKMYHDILTVVAHARDKSGNRNFEAHALTRFYYEIIQATEGSHWVLCMTLASAAEGIAKMLIQPDDRKSDFNPELINDFEKHIRNWSGNLDLRGKVLQALSMTKEKSVAQYLRTLRDRGILEKKQVEAWGELRNHVMHGNLVSPWSSEESDSRLISLIQLVHSLSREYVRSSLAKIGGQAHQYSRG